MNEATMSQDAGWVRPVLLQQAREAAGLHIAALAAALKVPVKKLEALEAGRYEELPDLTFARALASSACRHLKVDPAPVLEEIPFSRTPMLGDTPSTINAPFKPAQGGSTSLAAEWLRRPAVLASLLLVLAAVGLLLAPDWGVTVDKIRQSVPEPVSSTVSPAPVATERMEPGPDVSVAAQPASALQAAPDAPPATPASSDPVLMAPPASVADPAADQTVANESALLHIQAIGESWVEVVDGKGASQVQRMLKAGDALDFSASPPYSVVVGRADAVQVTVRGQAFDVTPHARNSVARFQVK